jgi:hypothetical protein
VPALAQQSGVPGRYVSASQVLNANCTEIRNSLALYQLTITLGSLRRYRDRLRDIYPGAKVGRNRHLARIDEIAAIDRSY